jgi:hypothetical protein
MSTPPPINIDLLSEDELRDLNHRVVERLRMLSQLRAHGAMLKFSIGDRVGFTSDGRQISGIITRYNKKTVTVIADGGHHWTVSPGLLMRMQPPVEQPKGAAAAAREAAGQQPSVTVAPMLRLAGQGRGKRSR